MTVVPIWRMAHDTGASVAIAARKLGVEVVMVGTLQRNAVWQLLRGSVLKSLGQGSAAPHAGLDLQLAARCARDAAGVGSRLCARHTME